MNKVVVISGHPDLEKSYTNKVILDELATQVDSIDVRRLDTMYPDYQIDVEAEQKALLDADAIVFQFPYYWYSVPALLKKWIDDVFAFNFAFGPEGDKLKGKQFILSITVGGPEESYGPLGYNHFTIEQTLHPLQQLAYLAQMNYQKPVYTHGMVYIPGVYNKQEAVEERARHHVQRLIGRLDKALNSAESRINQFVNKWFEQFDHLPEDDSYFVKQLSDTVVMKMAEGDFHGHAGFRDWYKQVRQQFKPGCDHQVQQVEISSKGNGRYAVDLRVQLIADTFDGETIDLLVNEDWVLTLSSNGQVTIEEYMVTVV